MIKNGKIKLKQYMQINRNNDLLLLNLVNKYLLSDLLKLEITMIKKRKKLKLKQYKQIYRNNDLLLLNLAKKYVLSDLLKLEMVLDFRIS